MHIVKQIKISNLLENLLEMIMFGRTISYGYFFIKFDKMLIHPGPPKYCRATINTYPVAAASRQE